MTTQTSIEWTEQTWNPTTGCTKISPGCKHCYAEVMARRLHAMGAPGYENGFKLAILPERLVQPLQRKKPTVYFVNSMSDLFHEDIPDQFLDQVFSVIRQTPQHTYQILTKRAERLPEYFKNRGIPVEIIRKIHEKGENCEKYLKSGKVDMVLNTISYGSQIEQEGYDLRRIAVELAIPCLTSLDTAREVLRVMAEAAGENRNVEAIQDYIGEN